MPETPPCTTLYYQKSEIGIGSRKFLVGNYISSTVIVIVKPTFESLYASGNVVNNYKEGHLLKITIGSRKSEIGSPFSFTVIVML